MLGSVEDWIWFRLIFIKVLGSVVITSVFTLALMSQPPMGHKRVTPLEPPRLRTYRLPASQVPSLIVSADGRLYSHPCSWRLKRASCPFSLPSLFTRQLKCAFNFKVNTMIFGSWVF